MPASIGQGLLAKMLPMSDSELNRFRGISNRVGVTPDEMRQAYYAALLQSPDLKFGHFVAANVLAEALGGQNLRSRQKLYLPASPVAIV
jgi:hypothetical protein